MSGTCGCEYNGISEDGRIEWRTAGCAEHRRALVTSEDLMFYERSTPVPWPEERPYEQTLSSDELEG